MRRHLAFLALTACGASTPSSPTPPAPAPTHIASAPPEAALDLPDTDPAPTVTPETVSMIDAARHSIACEFDERNTEETDSYTFHGVEPAKWSDNQTPLYARCCVLPSSTILCVTSEQRWTYVKYGNGESGSHHYIQRALFFDENGRKPWLDIVLAAFHPGSMRDPYGGAKYPLLSARIELDATSLRVVPLEDKVCAQPDVDCEGIEDDARACAAYRKKMRPIVQSMCKARGEWHWRKKRLVR